MNHIAYTLEADTYISPEIHKKELEAIFYRSWQYACHRSQLKNAGDYFAFSIGSQEIFVIRGKDDLVRAFFNVCPHRAHPLVSGCGNKQSLVCPYHAWTFFLNGQLLKARGSENVEGFDSSRFNLTEARIEEFLGFYFVNLDEKSPPLKSLSGQLESELLQRFPEILKVENVSTRSVEGSVNWKTLVDDHLDSDAGALNTPVTTQAICSRLGTDFWWLWPNFFLKKMADHKSIAVMTVRSLHAKGSREDLQVLSVDPVQEYESALAWVHDEKHVQNMARCEQVQNGYSSRAFQRGPLFTNSEKSGNSEQALLHFHSLVRDALSRLKVSSKTLRPTQREANAPV
jgi:nitrite reductase/ring-hydroxylating ferredoxin subunit